MPNVVSPRQLSLGQKCNGCTPAANTLPDHTPDTVRFRSYLEPRRLSLFTVTYLVAIGYGYLFPESVSAPLWVPDSVFLCALLLTPRKQWWQYVVVGLTIRFIPALHPAVPSWFVFATSVNDMLKGLLVAYFLLLLARGSFGLSTLREFTVYLGIAVFLAPALSALGGAAARQVLGYKFWPAWNQWFLGDALANLVLTPTLLYWCTKRFREVSAPVLETFLWITGFGLSLCCIFFLSHSNYAPLALYVPLPFLVWAAVRFGPIGASSALSFLALLSVVGIARVVGASSLHPESHDVLLAQLFLGVMSVPVLFVAILVEERSAVERQLRETQEILKVNYERARDLAKKLISSQEDERKRIARDLHDDINQRLALLSVEIQRMRDVAPATYGELRSRMDELGRRTSEISNGVQSLSHELHSSRLDYLGLVSAMKGFCGEFGEKHKVEIDFNSEGVSPTLPQEISICLFRVMQEGLHNALKHSGVRFFEVKLHGSPSEVQLTVRDSGVGFDLKSAGETQGLGLISMRERIRLVNGTLSIKSRPQSGTEVSVRVPLSDRMPIEQSMSAGA